MQINLPIYLLTNTFLLFLSLSLTCNEEVKINKFILQRHFLLYMMVLVVSDKPLVFTGGLK